MFKSSFFIESIRLYHFLGVKYWMVVQTFEENFRRRSFLKEHKNTKISEN